MKVYKYVIVCVFLSFIAPAIADSVSCMDSIDKDCDFIAKSKGDDIYIYKSKQSKPVFGIPETASSVEAVSFLKKKNKYILIKETSNSNRTKEILSFDDKLNEFKYFYLTSEIDFNQNNKYWHGIYCFLSNASISSYASSPLKWAFDNVCKKRSETQSEYKYVGTDLFFSIDSVINGEMGKMQLVALNAKDNDNVNISNFGCLENCSSVSEFTGKINNKYVVKMSLNLGEGMIEGHYYYDKIRVLIPIKGIKNDKEIILKVEWKDGKIKEIFDGIFDGNKIQGVWDNKLNNTKYPFVLYSALD